MESNKVKTNYRYPMERSLWLLCRKERFIDCYFCYVLMYTFYYFSWALVSSLISVYLLDIGCTAEQVGFVISASFLFSMLLQPFIGMLCDRFNYKIVNGCMLAAAGLCGLGFISVQGLFPVTLMYGLLMALINGTNLSIEKMATEGSYSYGKIRIWGTIGFAGGSWFAGILYMYMGPSAIFYCFFFTILLTIFGLWGIRLRVVSSEKEAKQSYGSALLQNFKYIKFLLIAAIFFGCTNTAITYIPAMLQYEGLGVDTISAVQSIAVICEAPVILFGYRWMKKVAVKHLLLITYLIAALQFLVYVSGTCMPLQILATFFGKNLPGMLFTILALTIVQKIVPNRYQISALALMATVSKNLSTILFQSAAGRILQISSYQVLFLILFILLLIGMILVVRWKVIS